MKWLPSTFVLFLLVLGRRYRARWERAARTESDALDDVDASKRRGDAADNGGEPRLQHVL